MLFNDYDLIKSKLDHNKFDSEIQGLTNAYSSVLTEYNKIKRNLFVSVTTSILGIIILISVYLFTINIYVIERKMIFVRTIHGDSF